MASQRTDAEAGHQDTGRSTPLFFVSQVLNNSCEPGVMSGCADLTTTPLCRREAGRLGKRLGEVSLVGESAFESDLRYIGKSWDGMDAHPVPAVTLLDAMFAWDNGPLRLSLNVANLTDRVQLTTCLARGDCFYGQRRTVTASATYRF